MATLATMKGLWSVIQSMSLTESNKRWLADKLIEPVKAKTEDISYPALDRALEDVKKAVLEQKTIGKETVNIKIIRKLLG